MAQGITILPSGTGGYVVDRTGALHPFSIGSNSPPPSPTNEWNALPGRPLRGVSVVKSGVGGYTIDGIGPLHRFSVTGLPPTTSGVPTWPGWDIARDVAILPGS